MIMARNQHTKRSIQIFKKDFKRHLKMTLLCFVLWFIVMSLGTVLFIYIEHCYDPMANQRWGKFEKGYFSLCRLLNKLPHNSTTSTPLRNQSWIQNATQLCNKSSLEFKLPKCEFDFSTFNQWFDFTMTLGYTVGFGFTVPFSDAGKIATIFYAIPAIVLTMVFNIYIGSLLVDFTRMIIVYFETKFLIKKSVRHLNFKVFLYQVVAAALACVLSAKISQDFFNDQSFGALMYFSFIALTTIGFGDIPYNPDSNDNDYGVFELITITLLFNLTLGIMASMLTGLSELFGSTDVRAREQKEKRLVARVFKTAAASKQQPVDFDDDDNVDDTAL